MTREWHKEVQYLAAHPKELRLDELTTLLYRYGYRLKSSRGSHVRFSKANSPSITIPSHHKKVKKWYIKDVCKMLLLQQPV